MTEALDNQSPANRGETGQASITTPRGQGTT